MNSITTIKIKIKIYDFESVYFYLCNQKSVEFDYVL